MTSFEKSKTTLGLEMATDPRWVNIAEKSIEFILTDHAWCEQKAAVHGISIISKFSKFPSIVEVISPIVAEEWEHFRKVVKELKSRGFELGHQRKDEYVNRLNNFIRKGDHVHKQIIEYLLSFAMIEARSCERFRLLSIHVQDLQHARLACWVCCGQSGSDRGFGACEVLSRLWRVYPHPSRGNCCVERASRLYRRYACTL